MNNLEKLKKQYKQFNDIINSIFIHKLYNQKNIINLAISPYRYEPSFTN